MYAKMTKINNSYAWNGHTDILVMIIELFRDAEGIIPEKLKSIWQF